MASVAKTGAPNKGVKYTFAGQYFSKKGKEKITKPYELDVVFAESTPGALSMFRIALLDTTSNIYKLMLKKYPDYTRFRTHTILSEVNLSSPAKAPKTIDRMNKVQLAKYIANNDLKIDVELFGDDIAIIRQYITECEENPEEFAVKYEQVKKEFESKKMLNDLNPVDDENGGGSNDPDANDLLEELDGDDDNTEDDELDLEDVD